MSKYLGLIFFVFFSCSVNAGILDAFSDPSTQILNQKNCWLFSEIRRGQMIEGKFIFNNQKILADFKKLDKNRVVFRRLFNLDPGETPSEIVLLVHKQDKNISASFSDGRVVLNCN